MMGLKEPREQVIGFTAAIGDGTGFVGLEKNPVSSPHLFVVLCPQFILCYDILSNAFTHINVISPICT